MVVNCQEHIAKIREDFQATQRVKDSLNNSIQALARDLYSKDTHFIFELIQNAEDNSYQKVEPSLSFRLLRADPTGTQGSFGALIIQNNEIGFSSNNVEAICAVGKTTKSKIQGYIGEKGIGFKSVFRVTSIPHIFSNGYNFCLPEREKETGLGYIVPQWIAELPSKLCRSQTTIILPLDKSGFDYAKIKEMLHDIEPESILFLSKLREIKIETDTGDTLTILKDDSKMPLVQILVEGERQGKVFSAVDEFLLSAQSFDKPEEITQEKREGIEDREVSIAFPVNQNNEAMGKLFAYLPVRSDTGLPFLINADFILPSSREDIQDVPWNRWLMKCVSDLVAKALRLLKERSLLTVDFLEMFAGRLNQIAEDKDSMFYPIVVAVCEALMVEDLIPSYDGTFVSAQNAKISRSTDLRDLLSADQLRLLFKATQLLKWVSAEITQDKTPELRRYLMEQLGIEEVRPEKFVDLLTDHFLENQPEEWIINFYSFLGADRTVLWKKPDAALRKRKIIRLENNSHVVPFKSDGTPNAYLPSTGATNFPTIKKSIIADENASDFLKKLGMIEPDLFAEIIEFILPKYAEGTVIVDHATNIDDLKKIKRLLEGPFQGGSSSSLAKVKILLGKLGLQKFEDHFADAEPGKIIPLLFKAVLPSVRILKASNGLKSEYKAPRDMYKRNLLLTQYFKDNPESWFITDDYPDELLSMLRELGVNDSPKVTKRSADNNEFIIISNSHGYHRRGLKGFDPDIKVEGLSIALSSPTTEKSLFIWNKIVLPNAECIRGTIEKSSRQTYENSSKEERISESFGRLLMESKWLPGPDGVFHCPSELGLDELPDQFERIEDLADMLGMKKKEKIIAANILSGGNPRKRELIELIANSSDDELNKFEKLVPRQNPPTPPPSFSEGLKHLIRPQRGDFSMLQEFDEGHETHPVKNPERYQDKCDKAVANAFDEHSKTHQIISFSPVRKKPDNKEAREFLYVEYQGQCQITGTTFPKASANPEGISENYFEACSLLPYSNASYLNDAGNMLCVSADTMAKLKHASFEWLDDINDKVAEFEGGGGKAQRIGIKIKLAGEESTITWSQRHFMLLVSLYKQT